jgi:BirA family biotin operon repressor/biotin-[acetyl-CoA-carboxylase] ligase
MKSPDRILDLLYARSGGFASLEELAEGASLTRRRVDACLEELRHRGHVLESSPAHGVRLVRPVRLDAHLIERGLGTHRVGRNVICFAEVDSTNDVAFASARQAGAGGLVVLAESQRRGRGRLGRRWVSPPGQNILMSVLLVSRGGRPLAQDALTIATGVGVAEGIELACGLSCELKWPNDVLLYGRKLAGVLVEVRRHDRLQCTVLGVGINANAAPADSAVHSPAVCLAERLGHPVERIEVVRAVLRRLDDWLRRVAEGDLDGLKAAWMGRCGMLNQRLRVSFADADYVGRVLDISPMEGMILCCDDGRVVHLPAAGSTVVG